ncbi:MAG: isocitrate/isopropylmalate dehydrogenase family protein [Nitrososphaerota archaeon]|nr:isocitrate/isopropylmalate dehydrogenase family protein [Nitrososphaerota archaeon]
MKKVALIRGDGTGPELVDAMLPVLQASGSKAEYVSCDAGADWWEKNKGPTFVPDATWKVLEEASCCFKGPTTTLPIAGTPRSVAISIRQKFNLYANVRPVKTFPNRVGPMGDVDFLCVREGTEGLYSGIEYKATEDVALAVRVISRGKSTKVSKYAFEEARRRGWKKLAAINKANILKVTDGLFLESVHDVGKNYPEVEIEDLFIDNFAQQLVKNPQRFNQTIVLGTNLFMDILSEEAAGLVGSIAMIYSANFGDNYAMFEPAHGSTPKYRGMNKVNPAATILSGSWMLEYIGEEKQGKAVFDATMKVIGEGKHVTYDLGGTAGTKEMAQAIIAKL